MKELTLGVRLRQPPQTASQLIPIDPGQTIVLDKSKFDGLIAAHQRADALRSVRSPGSTCPICSITSTAIPMGAPSRSRAGRCRCSISTTSRPVLGLGTDDALHQRVQDAIADLLTQSDLDRRLRPLGTVRYVGPLARQLRHGLPAARQGQGLHHPRPGDEQRPRQPGQPGVSRPPTSTRAARIWLTRSTIWRAAAGRRSVISATTSKPSSTISARRSPRPSSAPRSRSMAIAAVPPRRSTRRSTA